MTKQTTKSPKLTSKQLAVLKESSAKADEYLNQLKRLAAEFDNYKKRMIREQTNAVAFASRTLIERLLPIIDDLERAIEAVNQGQPAETVAKGVELTYLDIEKLLLDEGVEKIDPQECHFDPAEHEAIAQVDSDQEPETVVQVLQKGYRLKNIVIRPAKVTISK